MKFPADGKTMKAKLGKKVIKTKGTFKGKSNKLGGGGRFAQLAKKAGGGKKGTAIAAAVGRKKYGAKRFAGMAAKGKKKKFSKMGGKMSNMEPS